MPVGKAEVVLDPRRRAGLAAEGAAVERDRREALRAGVDRRRQARGSGADDGHVVDPVRVDRADQADAARQLHLGRDCAAPGRRRRARSATRRASRATARAAPWPRGPRRRRAAGADGRCGCRNSTRRRTPGWSAGPTITGPPAPISSSADAAQDQRAHDASRRDRPRPPAPRAAPAGVITSASTGSVARASTSDGRPLSWASSPMNEPG